MSNDIKQFPTLEAEEQESFLKIIGLLALLDSIQTDYSGKVADYLTDSSLNALMIMLAQQEVIHNHSYSYVLSSIVDKKKQDEVFNYWRTEETLVNRNKFIIDGYKDFTENTSVETLLKSLVYDVILEGLFFYSGFAFFYSLARYKKMMATTKMINFINRDEQIHVDLFAKIFKEILNEYPEYRTEELEKFVKDTIREATELEMKWAEVVIGNHIDGISTKEVQDYVKFIANKRCRELGYKDGVFEGYKTNNIRWIKYYEDVNEGKTDYFEQRNASYEAPTDDNGFDEL